LLGHIQITDLPKSRATWKHGFRDFDCERSRERSGRFRHGRTPWTLRPPSRSARLSRGPWHSLKRRDNEHENNEHEQRRHCASEAKEAERHCRESFLEAVKQLATKEGISEKEARERLSAKWLGSHGSLRPEDGFRFAKLSDRLLTPAACEQLRSGASAPGGTVRTGASRRNEADEGTD